ncbi:hypothetical protein, partial [Siminovitchia acidinfaciens]|uniref:hypothetical protein n=1 Tax=Siminovitchia acidinfaciens TaxID=2321395 RepID=UPI0019D04C94
NRSHTFVSILITEYSIYFLFYGIFGHKKTTPPIVRWCLTIRVQFRLFHLLLLFHLICYGLGEKQAYP